MSKYGNIKVTVLGQGFDSKAEAKRYLELVAGQKAGEISGLRLQVPFVLAPSVKYAGAARAKPELRYVADFVYEQNGVQVVEDVKGRATDAYIIKKHLMKALLGIEISEVRSIKKQSRKVRKHPTASNQSN